MQVSIG
jgi:hypothetical protein